MPRFLIAAQIQVGDAAPSFNTYFIVVAPNDEMAFDLAHEYLIHEWYADHYVCTAPTDVTVIVDDLIVERLTAEQIARRLTCARVSSAGMRSGKEVRHEPT